VFNNDQPSLAVNFLIATSGIVPSRDGAGPGFATNLPILGQIVEFAGSFAPSGWAFTEGQELSISQNTALFSILGNTYGGNGTTTFALPQLRGTTLLGTGSDAGTDYPIGDGSGSDAGLLTLAQIPEHVHSLPTVPSAPEPSTWAMIVIGFAGLGLAGRRRRKTAVPAVS
jgi:microcystin-dependent protein